MKFGWPYRHDGIGNVFGYSTMERHLLAAMEANGVEVGLDGKVLVHFIPFYHLQQRRFRHNVLFTMYEFDRVPSQWVSKLQRPELIIVPCSHNQRVISEVTPKPVEICPAGVDSDLFAFKKRKRKEPFTFLYVGANNARKGTYYVAKAWEVWNERYPELADESILIMKETEDGAEQELKQVTKNAYVDTRVLPLDEDEALEKDVPSLMSVYHSAQCFLFPTMGEGFGLTLVEAMSTGLPCIYTPYSGPEDIGEELLAYPIRYGMKKIELQDPSGIEIDPVYAAEPDVDSIVENMHNIFTDYDEALERGRIAATKMQEYYSWDKAAKRLIEILSAYYPEEME